MKKLILLAMVASAVGAHAQVFYDNGGPNQQNGNEMTMWMQTEDFKIGQDTAWFDLHFWTIETPGAVNDGTFYVALYNDDGAGNPNAIIADGTFTQNVNYTKTFLQAGVLGVYDEYRYDMQISGYVLAANTQYHLGLHANPSGGYQTRDNIYWETTNANGTAAGLESFQGPNGGWSSNGTEHAFNLTTVPEPASMVALGAGLLALARRRRASK